MSCGPPVIDTPFVRRWAARYVEVNGPDRRMLEEVGPRVRDRGCYDLRDMIAVVEWKSPRTVSTAERNPDRHVRYLSAAAFGAPEELGADILCLLWGVRWPVASALLTVWDPDRHTVLDRRARSTLRQAGELDPEPVAGYTAHLALCRRIAARTGADLRSLDRALWQWSREHDPELR